MKNIYYKSGKILLEIREFQNHKRGVYYYETGEIRGVIELVNDKLHGFKKVYYISGGFKKLAYFHKGRLIEQICFDEIQNINDTLRTIRFLKKYENYKEPANKKDWWENGVHWENESFLGFIPDEEFMEEDRFDGVVDKDKGELAPNN
jgi:hypothetical protein